MIFPTDPQDVSDTIRYDSEDPEGERAEPDLVHPQFNEVIPDTGHIGIIVGDIGQGKSCLAYSLLEHFGELYGRPMLAYGIPEDKQSVLPEHIQMVNALEDIPEHSVCLFDESYLAFYCVSEDTLVKTDRGNIQIKDLSIGDRVLSLDVTKKEEEYKKVTWKSKPLIRETIEIHTEDGIVTCSPEHRWFVQKDDKVILKQAKDLTIDDAIICLYDDKN